VTVVANIVHVCRNRTHRNANFCSVWHCPFTV